MLEGWNREPSRYAGSGGNLIQISTDRAVQRLPARLQEQALVDYFASRSEEVSRRVGREIRLEKLKIVTMLDVALRGIGNHWSDVRIPGLDYLVVENTLGKYGTRVETLTRLLQSP